MAYQMRGIPTHTCHEELKIITNQYTQEIKDMKKQHWIEWLEDIEGNDVWTGNKNISSELKDAGKTRILTLKVKHPDGSSIEANTN